MPNCQRAQGKHGQCRGVEGTGIPRLLGEGIEEPGAAGKKIQGSDETKVTYGVPIWDMHRAWKWGTTGVVNRLEPVEIKAEARLYPSAERLLNFLSRSSRGRGTG